MNHNLGIDARPKAPLGLAGVIARVAAEFDSGGLGPGERAELRRLDPAKPSQPAFWKVLAQIVSPDAPLPPGAELRWAAALTGLARMGPDSHAPSRRAGGVLADCGYSEARFQRLLRSEGATLADAFRRTCAFLAQKAERVDWTELARLVLETDPARRESTRRELARQYYNTLYRAEREEKSE